MITAITGKMAEDVFNVLIVLVFLFFKYRVRHRLGTGIVLQVATGLAPVSEKTQTIPIPSYDTIVVGFNKHDSFGRCF